MASHFFNVSDQSVNLPKDFQIADSSTCESVQPMDHEKSASRVQELSGSPQELSGSSCQDQSSESTTSTQEDSTPKANSLVSTLLPHLKMYELSSAQLQDHETTWVEDLFAKHESDSGAFTALTYEIHTGKAAPVKCRPISTPSAIQDVLELSDSSQHTISSYKSSVPEVSIVISAQASTEEDQLTRSSIKLQKLYHSWKHRKKIDQLIDRIQGDHHNTDGDHVTRHQDKVPRWARRKRG